MTGDAPSITSDEVRYQGKAVHDEQWILDFLGKQQSGVLGLVKDSKPHLITQLFVYDSTEASIYFHGAKGGVGYDTVKNSQPASASFTTSTIGRYIPAEQPVNFTVEYASVVANGTIELLEENGDKYELLEQFMEKYAPQLTPSEDYNEISWDSLARTAVYQLTVDSWTAKKSKKDPDYPGAYNLD